MVCIINKANFENLYSLHKKLGSAEIDLLSVYGQSEFSRPLQNKKGKHRGFIEGTIEIKAIKVDLQLSFRRVLLRQAVINHQIPFDSHLEVSCFTEEKQLGQCCSSIVFSPPLQWLSLPAISLGTSFANLEKLNIVIRIFHKPHKSHEPLEGGCTVNTKKFKQQKQHFVNVNGFL